METATITDQEIVDQTRARLKLDGKVWCFIAGMHPHPRAEKQFLLAVAILGEAGYTVPANTQLFETFNGASEVADRLNALLPWNSDTCIMIVGDTMNRSRTQQEQAQIGPLDRVYSMKITFRTENKASLYEDEMPDEIRRYLEEEIADAFGIDTVEVDLK